MSKRSSSDTSGESDATSEATIVKLIIQISDFVQEGTLDSRCAAKLVKRLRKEAEAISDSSKTTKAGKKELVKAFDMADAVLRAHDAGLLVTANADLRSTDVPDGRKPS